MPCWRAMLVLSCPLFFPRKAHTGMCPRECTGADPGRSHGCEGSMPSLLWLFGHLSSFGPGMGVLKHLLSLYFLLTTYCLLLITAERDNAFTWVGQTHNRQVKKGFTSCLHAYPHRTFLTPAWTYKSHCQAWWCIPVTQMLGRQRQEDHFNIILNSIVSSKPV